MGVGSCLIPVPSVDVVGSASLLLEEVSLVVGVASDLGVVSVEVGVVTDPAVSVAFKVKMKTKVNIASSAISNNRTLTLFPRGSMK